MGLYWMEIDSEGGWEWGWGWGGDDNALGLGMSWGERSKMLLELEMVL